MSDDPNYESTEWSFDDSENSEGNPNKCRRVASKDQQTGAKNISICRGNSNQIEHPTHEENVIPATSTILHITHSANDIEWKNISGHNISFDMNFMLGINNIGSSNSLWNIFKMHWWYYFYDGRSNKYLYYFECSSLLCSLL